jgi:hypothetical protein
MRDRYFVCASLLAFVFLGRGSASAASAPTASGAAAPSAYQTFLSGGIVENGLIPIVTKDGKTYLALSSSQIGQDFIETSVPSTGLGGYGPAAGEPYVAPARIFRFERYGNNIVLQWPNTYADVRPGTAEALATKQSFPSSVIAVTPIVAEGDGKMVVSADAFLGDVGNYEHIFQEEISSPLHGYHLDPTRSFFEATKAFPENDVIRVSQTWESADPDVIDSAPDARSLEVVMSYNLIEAPRDGYMPRLSDPRVGYFVTPLLNFSSDALYTRNEYYIDRWNFEPADPGRASVATHPIVYYLSDDIPVKYHATIRDAILTWNQALRRVGILDGIQVRQEPSDANWDPDDIRYNVVRWADEVSGGGGATALIVTDPRTGELLNVGISILAGLGTTGFYHYIIAPERGLPDNAATEAAYKRSLIFAVVLHESGHDLGLQHNFLAPYAYTAEELQSKAFTSKYGIASSVMSYTLFNLWPPGTAQGALEQLVLGPYDYHAVQYGYGYIRASTPREELPALRRIAEQWSNPLYRFASDEDAAFFANGHSIDPRVSRDILTNHPLAWCNVQHRMMYSLMNSVLQRFPARGGSYDDARRAFAAPMEIYLLCALQPAHTIGGEYLSRNDRGDPNATPPLRAVPRREEIRAWHFLSEWVFSDAAWTFNADVLRHLTYSEESLPLSPGNWAYEPSPRHDVPIVEQAATVQEDVLDEIFAPLTLERIDDLSTKYPPGATMSIADLFDWARASIFGDIGSGAVARDGPVRRNLQVEYARRLAALWTAPAAGAPSDAQMLARLQLVDLENDAGRALRRNGFDETVEAHLEGLVAIARQALEARATIASP